MIAPFVVSLILSLYQDLMLTCIGIDIPEVGNDSFQPRDFN